ncbi:MAG: PAS domain-containing protein [Gemmataceae bacterium]
MPLSDEFADELPVGIFRIDSDRRYLYVNRRAAALIGRTPAEVVGKTLPELTGPTGLADYVKAQSDRVFATGQTAEYEVANPADPAGHLLTKLVPETGPGGRVRTVLGVVTDVTAVKSAEDARQTVEERLRRAMDAARVCTWEYETADGRFRSDAEFWQWLGRDPAASAKTVAEWVEWLHPDDLPARATALAALRAGRAAVAEYDIRATAADGSVRWFQVGRRPTATRPGCPSASTGRPPTSPTGSGPSWPGRRPRTGSARRPTPPRPCCGSPTRPTSARSCPGGGTSSPARPRRTGRSTGG